MAKLGNYIGVGLAGLAIGAALGLLYAPQTGSETREMLKQRANTFRMKASKMANRSRHEMSA